LEHPPYHIRIADYFYALPPERIAQFPVEPRDSSRLLVWKNGQAFADVFSRVPMLLPPGSLVIFNETKVIRARLVFHKPTGAPVEIFCLEPATAGADLHLALQQTSPVKWNCLVGNARRWKQGPMAMSVVCDQDEFVLRVIKRDRSGEAYQLEFSWDPPGETFAGILEVFGKVPLPPYIRRKAGSSDITGYQTVFARREGSVAAPTAGLHFTEKVLDGLKERSIRLEKVTLHVGVGTFRPVSAEKIGEHEMHAEQVSIPRKAISALLDHLDSDDITLVGTTSVRTIESVYWQGVKWMDEIPGRPLMEVKQWDPYETESSREVPVREALERVLEVLDEHGEDELRGSTALMIAPGYRYRLTRNMITNFHLPRSTLLLLVAAFAGGGWKEAYRYALDHGFRFLSYGDACLFMR
jgi:S-adenosylmethionine:tRNA ribosyltransferase-isomerase